MDRFKGRYRHADVLLIDDVQFLAVQGQDRGGVLPHLQRAARPRQPARADLRPPPARPRAPSRTACASASRPAWSPPSSRPTSPRASPSCASAPSTTASSWPTTASCPLLADRAPDSVRALEGALIRVVAYASLTGRPLDHRASPRRSSPTSTPSRAERRARAPLTVEAIQDITADAFGLSRDELLSTSRAARLAWPRQVAMYLAREHTGETLPAIGARFARPQPHRPSCTPAGAPPQRIAADPEAFDFVRRLTEQLHPAVRGHTAARQFSPA